MKLEWDNNLPIYIQVVDILKKDIVSGSIKPGERLPSVRDLAISMKVNPNTMQKALNCLEDLNLIYTERTNGKYITEDKEIIVKLKYEYANNIANEYLSNMESLGFSKLDAIKYLKDIEGDKK